MKYGSDAITSRSAAYAIELTSREITPGGGRGHQYDSDHQVIIRKKKKRTKRQIALDFFPAVVGVAKEENLLLKTLRAVSQKRIRGARGGENEIQIGNIFKIVTLIAEQESKDRKDLTSASHSAVEEMQHAFYSDCQTVMSLVFNRERGAVTSDEDKVRQSLQRFEICFRNLFEQLTSFSLSIILQEYSSWKRLNTRHIQDCSFITWQHRVLSAIRSEQHRNRRIISSIQLNNLRPLGVTHRVFQRHIFLLRLHSVTSIVVAAGMNL